MCGNWINPSNRKFLGGPVGQTIAPIALGLAAPYLLGGIGALGGIAGEGVSDSSGLLGTGLSGSLSGAIGGGLGGALAGSPGGVAGALKGGALGAGGGYLANGGASQLLGGTQLGNTLGLTNPAEGSLVGNALGSTPGVQGGSGLLSGLLSGSGSAPTAADTNFLNKAAISSQGFSPAETNFLSNANAGLASPSLGAGTGGGISSYGGLGTIAQLGGAANSLYANSKAQKDLLNANNQAQAQIAPYTASGAAANSKLSDLLGTGNSPMSSADILAASPQYQFQLDQGNQALDRRLAASGGLDSGGAIKAGQEFGQGLANQTAQQYYSNLAGQSGQGFNAANASGNLYGSTGTAKANAGIESANITNQALSSLLNGSGAKRPVNIGGQIYYM